MKIDILTLHNIRNYGSVLQTYATQTILEKMNNEVEVINYYRENEQGEKGIENRINNSAFFSNNYFTRLLGKMFLIPSIKKQTKVFNDFLEKNINLTKEYYSNEELRRDIPKADIYCTGSDQVWNSDWNGTFDKTYFFDFLSEKVPRFSYAASFGKNQITDTKERNGIKKLLKRYKAISVREKSAVEIVKNLGIDTVKHVLDPTLLLNKEEWLKIKENIKIKKPYILVYQLNTKNPAFDKYVKELAKKKKMSVIRISTVNYQLFKYGHFVFCPTVNQFLTYFDEAEYVVTDSFHATAFSINFNKKFICIFPEKFSTRLQSILDLTNLKNRRIIDFNNLNVIDEKIDYKQVNEIINKERENSINFIRKAINECKKGE